MFADPESLYTLHGVDIKSVCDATDIPYSVLVDFDLPFHGELVHVNEISMTVSVNDNPDMKRGHLKKDKLVTSTFQPLFSGSNILAGGKSSLDFTDSANLHDMALAGSMAMDMMNMCVRERTLANCAYLIDELNLWSLSPCSSPMNPSAD